MLVLSFHGVGGRSCTIHKALHYNQQDVGFDTSRIDWKIIILGMVSALKYLHDHNILHNDIITSDNIVVDDRSSSIQCVFIDFGNCFAADGRSYARRNNVDTQLNTHKLRPIFGMVIASNLSSAMCIH